MMDFTKRLIFILHHLSTFYPIDFTQIFNRYFKIIFIRSISLKYNLPEIATIIIHALELETF